MKQKPKKCKTDGFVAECVECGQAFFAATHITPKCGGGFGGHDRHDADDCCGYGDHTESRKDLVCTDCVFYRNISRLTR